MIQTMPLFIFPENHRVLLITINMKNMDTIAVTLKNRIPNTLDMNMKSGCSTILESITRVIVARMDTIFVDPKCVIF